MTWKEDLYSKCVDGVVASLVLVLLMLVVALLQTPVYMGLGRPGMLIFVVAVIAFVAYSLEHAMLNRFTEATRLWWGMVGGILAWAVTSMANKLGNMRLTGAAAMILFLMLALVAASLWRRVLPLGVRYFALAYGLNWVAQFVLESERVLAVLSPAIFLMYRLLGYLAIVAGFVALVWIFFRSQSRLQRLKAALWIWFFTVVALYIFWGRFL